MNIPPNCSGLILASKSPRRKHLLEQAGLKFSIMPSDIDESSLAMSDPASYVRKLAEFKALDVSQKHPDSWVIGADTIVLIDNRILGKPGSKDEAREMLKHLSGKSHQVLTGYCICCGEKKRLFSETIKTGVHFKKLRPEEIDWYIESGEPLDKAGAYAIQGVGSFLVRSIDGSYTNVVGLPVCEVIEFLIKQGVIRLNPKSRSLKCI
jgi:nucleoside triphosphate pyrophosphatase